jgi:hypothetical protein
MFKPNSANMPASVNFQLYRFWMNSCAPLHVIEAPSESVNGLPLQTILDQWVDDPKYLLERVKLPADGGTKLAQGIIQGTARAVNDGSFKKGRIGTAACIVASDSQDNDCLEAVNMTPGLPFDQSAYRSELGGVIGSLTLILAVCKSFWIQDGSVTLALDGEAAMN